METVGHIIQKMKDTALYGGKTQLDTKSKKLTFSNGTPGSKLAAKGNVSSRYYTVNNLSDRLAKECRDQTAKFTICQIKHCTVDEQHYKLLMCFEAGQSTKAEVFAVHAQKGLLDSSASFPDLTRGYSFESKHSTILSAPTTFTTPNALRDSAEKLVEIFALDVERSQNKDAAGGREEILAWVIEQHRADGGILRKPEESDEAWAIAFERPGSDIMQRTNINTQFYRVDDIPCLEECLKLSDAHVNVLPIKFVHEDGGQWIALMCFGDKDGCLAEVNVIDLETGSLLMNDDDKDFPRLDEGVFVPIFPPGRVLRSKNKFVDPTSLSDKIHATATYLMDAMRVCERI